MCHLWHRLWIFLFRRKVMFRSQDIQVFVFLTIPCLPNLWRHDEYQYMRQGAFLNISFEPQLQIWPTDRYKQEQQFSVIFWTIWRTGAKFQVLFNLATCSSHPIINYVKIPVFHFFFFFFLKRAFKNDKCQLLTMARSRDIANFNKIIKGYGTVSSLQHWAKNMLKMFAMQHTSIWPNFISIVFKIQKK